MWMVAKSTAAWLSVMYDVSSKEFSCCITDIDNWTSASSRLRFNPSKTSLGAGRLLQQVDWGHQRQFCLLQSR